MPYIHIQTNAAISEDKKTAMTREFGSAISILGKSENWLMLRYEDRCDMAFRGDASRPVAFIGVSMYGQGRGLDAFSSKATELVSRALEIDPERIYIRYLSTQDWGWNGSNF